MSDGAATQAEALVAKALGITVDALQELSPADAYARLEASAEACERACAEAQGRINKKFASDRLTQAQAALEAARGWREASDLSSAIDEALKLADQGSMLQALAHLQRGEQAVLNSGDKALIDRFRQARELLQSTMRPPAPSEPKPESPSQSTASTAPTSAPAGSAARATTPAEDVESITTDRPARVAGESVPPFLRAAFDAPGRQPTDRTGPPPCRRFTLDLGAAGRLHVASSVAAITFGRHRSPHQPVYPLLAARPMDKDETARLIRMLSGRHGAIFHARREWVLADRWPDHEAPSTNGIFLDGHRVSDPLILGGAAGSEIVFATPEAGEVFPHFKIHRLESGGDRSSVPLLLERLDAFRDHILLLAGSVRLPSEFGGIRLAREGDGFVRDDSRQPIHSKGEGVLGFDRFEISPLEPVFYGRPI